MAETMLALEQQEERSQMIILSDLISVEFDVLRIGLLGDQFADGMVPFSLADTFVHQTREALLAAACAAVQPQVAYGNRKPQKAMDYLRTARFGQTERGSFHLTVHSPVPPFLNQPRLMADTDDVPFERRVVLTLGTAAASLPTAAAAARATGAFQPFMDAVASGVNANLCDAFVGMFENHDVESLSLNIRLSKTRLPDIGMAETVVRIGRDTAPTLRQAAIEFRRNQPIDEFELEGFVTRLGRDVGEAIGTATVAALVDGILRNVHIRLATNDYEAAVQAHGLGRRVRCIGELGREGRAFRLEQARDLIVESDDELAAPAGLRTAVGLFSEL
ncbi:MAG: hypothetical protein ACKVT1_09605 [Dehalococcoidia bacterium]